MGVVSNFFQSNPGALTASIGAAASIGQAALQVTGGFQARSTTSGNARLLRLQGAQAEAQARREGKLLTGAQRARFASAGVDPNVGTPLDVVLNSEQQSRLAARRRRLSFESEADIQDQAGSIAVQQGLFGGAATLLGAVRSFVDSMPPKERTKPAEFEVLRA